MMSLAGGLLSPPSAASLSFKRPLISSLTPHFIYHHREKSCQPRISNVTCKAEFSQDAPLAVAIGACILNSVIFPISPGPDDDLEESSLIDSTDARLAVMGIISFIPYFNWLSWVFAWLDTGKQRYAVYSLVYLAPYLRSNLSISPEESWLPIASILFCIIHIQLEASIRNGDFRGFQLFGGSPKNLSSVIRKKQNPFQGHDGVPEEEGTEDYMNLPSARDQSRNEIRGWGVPKKPLQDSNHLNEDGDASNMKKQ